MADDKSAGWRDWLSKAVFESILIVVSILLALAVNEWRDARERRARVETAMNAIRAELEANLKDLESANAYNREVAAKLKNFGSDELAKGVVPKDVYPRGVMVTSGMVSTAWDSARALGVTADFPFQKLLKLGLTYQTQERFERSNDALFQMVYENVLRSPDAPFGNPVMLGGILSDQAGRGGGLINAYREALKELAR